MAKNEQTSEEIGSIAARVLRDRNAPMRYRRIAGSALTQRPDQPRWWKHVKENPSSFPTLLGPFERP
jgi:hypothetical protein